MLPKLYAELWNGNKIIKNYLKHTMYCVHDAANSTDLQM